MPGCPSTIDRFEALFRCRLIQLPARRSWRLPGRSCWPQLCHQPGHQRQASPCRSRSCLPACRRGGPRSLSEASARRSAAGATPLPAVRAGGGRGPRSISSRGPCHPPWCLVEETVCGGGRARCVAPAYINGLSRWALMGIALRDMHMRHATACVSRRVTSLIRHRSSTSSALGLASWACCQPLVTVCARVLSRVLAVLRHFYLYERAEGSYESARRTGGSGRGAL